MAGHGCTTTVRSIRWDYNERVEDVVNDVLRDATPPWRVSITSSKARNTWLVVAQPGGEKDAFTALLTPGLHSPEHVRRLIADFYRRALTRIAAPESDRLATRG